MKNQFNALLLTAALSGLVGGTSVAAHAATSGSTTVNSAKVMKAGLRYSGSNTTLPSTPVKAKTTARARAAASPATMAARARIAARARAVAPPTAPRCPTQSRFFPRANSVAENRNLIFRRVSHPPISGDKEL